MPKSSIDSPVPSVVQPQQDRLHPVRVGHHAGLGQLERQQVGRYVVLAQHAGDPVRELGVRQRAGGEVDRDRDAQVAVEPLPALGQRGAQHVVGEDPDETGHLGQRDEPVRRDLAVLRVQPADQRLDADQVAGAQVDLGLVADDDLAGGQRRPQLGDQPEPLQALLLHRRVVHAIPGGRRSWRWTARRRPGASSSGRRRRGRAPAQRRRSPRRRSSARPAGMSWRPPRAARPPARPPRSRRAPARPPRTRPRRPGRPSRPPASCG